MGGQRIGGYAQDREPEGKAEAAEDDQAVDAGLSPRVLTSRVSWFREAGLLHRGSGRPQTQYAS